MLLIAISPIAIVVPVVVIGGVTSAIYWARRMMSKPAPAPTPDTGDGDKDDADTADKGAANGDAAPTPDKPTAKCKRTGQAYDAKRWWGPPPVIAALQKLGYPLNSLTSKAGKAEILKFQIRARELALMGMSGAGDEWLDGDMGACSLISLSAAMNMLEAGNWPGP